MHITPCMDRRCIVTVRDELKIALVDSDWWSQGIKHTCSQTKILVLLNSHLCLVNYTDMSLSAQCLIEKKIRFRLFGLAQANRWLSDSL